MNISMINTAIIQGSFSNDQLSSIIDAVKFARARLAEQAKRNFRIGDSVQFTSTKTGVTYTGTVEKIAIKFITVNTGQGRWKVPASMLTAA